MRARFSQCLMFLAVLSVACNHKADEKVTLRLSAFPIGESGRYRLSADAKGPLSGIKYRFYADDGICEPELSDRPESLFSPPPGTSNQSIKVTVEALRGGVALESSNYTLSIPANAPAKAPPDTDSQKDEPQKSFGPRPAAVEITTVPRYDPAGGPDTREDIAGVVRGVSDPQTYRVILYAKTDFWYVQPLLGSTISITSDGKWSSWTHTGAEYAALLVREGYRPSTTLGSLPSEDGVSLIAKTHLPGVR